MTQFFHVLPPQVPGTDTALLLVDGFRVKRTFLSPSFCKKSISEFALPARKSRGHHARVSEVMVCAWQTLQCRVGVATFHTLPSVAWRLQARTGGAWTTMWASGGSSVFAGSTGQPFRSNSDRGGSSVGTIPTTTISFNSAAADGGGSVVTCLPCTDCLREDVGTGTCRATHRHRQSWSQEKHRATRQRSLLARGFQASARRGVFFSVPLRPAPISFSWGGNMISQVATHPPALNRVEGKWGWRVSGRGLKICKS